MRPSTHCDGVSLYDPVDARQFEAIDIAHLVEALHDMSGSLYAAVSSAIFQVLVHLLTWCYRSEKRSRSWQLSLLEHRTRLPRRLRQAPSLRRAIPQMIADEYPAARRKARLQTGLSLETFPTTCPWTVEQILAEDFFPEP